MSDFDDSILEEQELLAVILDTRDFEKAVTAFYFIEKDIALLRLIFIDNNLNAEHGVVISYINFTTFKRRCNFYKDSERGIKTFKDCENALANIEDCKLVWKGQMNSATNS